MIITFSKTRIFIIVSIFHFTLFGFGFLFFIENILLKATFFISFLFSIIFLLYNSHLQIKLHNRSLNTLQYISYISLLLGPILYLIIMIIYGVPAFNANPNIFRIVIRDNFFVDYIVTPMNAVFLYSTLLLSNKRLYSTIVRLFLLSLVGYLSAFRAASIVPFITYFIFLFITKKINFKFRDTIYISVSIFIAFKILLNLTQLRSDETGNSVDILFDRIFVENVRVNWMRYYIYQVNNGYQLGRTYIQDLLSVIRLMPNSFQSELSGGGKLVMNTPYFAELFLNFGYLSIFMTLIVSSVLLVVNLGIRLILKDFGPILVTYFILGVLPSIYQAGFTKYLFVEYPKLMIVLLISSLIRILFRGIIKYNV